MKILQVGTGSLRIPPHKYGAVELYIYNLSRGLAASGHEVTILDIRESPAEPDSEDLDGIKRLCIYRKRFDVNSRHAWLNYLGELLDLLGFSFKVNSHLRRQRYDIIHLHRLITSPILIFLNRGLRPKMVYTAHSSIWMEDNPAGLHMLALALDGYTMRRVAWVAAQAETLKIKFIRKTKIPPVKIAVIPSGVDTAYYRPQGVPTDEIKHKYGLEGRTAVLCVGHIIPRKGIEYLLKAAALLARKTGHSEVLFLLVGPLAQPGFDKLGSSDYVTRIREIIKQNGLEQRVRLTGAVSQEDLLGLFCACAIFVLPSLAESSPAVTLQAMACAKPIIATGVGGIPDQIKDGWNGFIVPPADEKALAQKIEYLLDNAAERLKMGRNARQLTEQEFDWENVARKVIGEYQKVRGR